MSRLGEIMFRQVERAIQMRSCTFCIEILECQIAEFNDLVATNDLRIVDKVALVDGHIFRVRLTGEMPNDSQSI